MKIYLALISFISFCNLSTTQDKLNFKKIWVSPYLEYLDLRQDDTVYFDYGMGYHEKYILEKNDSILNLVQYEKKYGDKECRKVVKSYKIIKLTNDTLLIHPLTKYSKVFLENEDKSFATKYHCDSNLVELNEKDIYVFFNKSLLYDNNLVFERLYFSSTSCLGSCPSMEFEIDSLGYISFIGKMNTGKYVGKYKGMLTKKQLDNLLEILKASALNYMPETLYEAIDAPNYNLNIAYNGKTKKIKGGDGYPYFNTPLFNYLLTIFEEVEMKRNKNLTFKLKNESK